MSQSRRAPHEGCEVLRIHEQRNRIYAYIESDFVPGEKNVARLQIKTQDALSRCISEELSTSHNLVGKANDAHRKPEPSCDAAKNTEYHLSAKQVNGGPRAIVVVELRVGCLLFGRRGTLRSAECTNASRASASIRGRIVFLCRAEMWGMLRMTESCECRVPMWSSQYIKILTNPHLRRGHIPWEEGRTAKWESWAQSWRIGPTRATHCGYVVGDDAGMAQ